MKYCPQSTIFFYQNWNEIESPSSHSPLYLNLVGSSACVTLALQNGIFISMKNDCLVTIFLEFIIWFVWTKNVTKAIKSWFADACLVWSLRLYIWKFSTSFTNMHKQIAIISCHLWMYYLIGEKPGRHL